MHILQFFAFVLPAAALQWPLAGQLKDQDSLFDTQQDCACGGINETPQPNTFYICNNASLGPKILPWRLPLLSPVSNYDRFGGLSPLQFLETWQYSDPKSGKMYWKYPEKEGFQLDTAGNPVKANITLTKGFRLDRFGSETGRFMAAADATFSQRPLPPDSLNVCKLGDNSCTPKDHPWAYHVYEVAQEFVVEAGPIAAGFGQPGGGTQYKLRESITKLLDDGILRRLALRDVHPGPGEQERCER